MSKFKTYFRSICAVSSLSVIGAVWLTNTSSLSANETDTVIESTSEAPAAIEEMPAVEALTEDSAVEESATEEPATEESAVETAAPSEEEPQASISTIQINKAALYPEGIEYNPSTGNFLLSSVREGTIYEVTESGVYTPFIEDERLVSTTGIHIDVERNRILVPNTDHGLSMHSDPERKLKMAELGIYDLTTGEPLAYADLAALQPESGHFANDVAVDNEGNAYVTDSVSPILYKVDPMGNASIFLENERFTGEGFNFNGIIYHPDGYLMVAKKNEGVLFKVPVEDPENFSEVEIDQQFPGADGLVLVDNNTLLIVANKLSDVSTNAVFVLNGEQAWENATVAGSYETGDVYPTTGVMRGDDAYVVFGQLSGLGAALKEDTPEFAESFQIQRVGSQQFVIE